MQVSAVSLFAWASDAMPKEVAETRRRLRAAKQSERRAQRRALDCGLTPRAANIALVYVLSNHDAILAATFICHSQKLPPSYDKTEFVEWVESKYLSCGLDTLVAYEMPETDADRKVHTQACKFISASRAAGFVERANLECGVTPSGRQVAEEYIRQCDQFGVHDVSPGLRRALGELSSPSSGGRCVRRWGRKFRLNWDLGFGKLPVREPMADSEVQDKAG